MVGLLLTVAVIILIYIIKSDRKREAREQAEAERRRGEAILRARAERTTKEQQDAKEQTHSEREPEPVRADISEAQASKTKSDCSYAEKTYRVSGISFRADSIMRLASENDDYDCSKKELIDNDCIDERIWKYEFYPSDVKLIPEPDNQHDPNAIKVIVDGEHIGYIKAGSCTHLLKVIKEDRIRSITCEIGGGPYKIVTEEYDEEKDKDVYTLERDETNFFAVLTVQELRVK